MIRMERLLWIHLFLGLMILFAGTNGLTEMEVDLEENITIPCSLKMNGAVFWYKQREAQSPLVLLRFLGETISFYYNGSFKKKYVLQTDEGLLIQNVTVEDYVVYYCGKIENMSMKFDDATRLIRMRQPGTISK